MNISTITRETGLICMYISVFGLSDLLVKNLLDNYYLKLLYFFIIFSIGFYLLNNNFKNKYLKNLKMKEE